MSEQCIVVESPEGFRCVRCGFTHPRRFRRVCVLLPGTPPPARELDWRGRVLIRLAPGTGLKWLIKYSGLAHLAEAWGAIESQDCPTCQAREEWLNEQWRSFVWQHFSRPL